MGGVMRIEWRDMIHDQSWTFKGPGRSFKVHSSSRPSQVDRVGGGEVGVNSKNRSTIWTLKKVNFVDHDLNQG